MEQLNKIDNNTDMLISLQILNEYDRSIENEIIKVHSMLDDLIKSKYTNQAKIDIVLDKLATSGK